MACPASVAAAEQREAAIEVGGIPMQSSPNLPTRFTGQYAVSDFAAPAVPVAVSQARKRLQGLWAAQ
ncbi:hypothetical protein U724_26725 [Pseudomonas chlororaphis subsp. aurantiaca PB-St2]|nr:hypothetical protein U724_26725 [Pseudomonas chlororaphis subsp. aurantiaca PB-St2]